MTRDIQKSKAYNAEFGFRRQMDFVAAGATALKIHNATVTVPMEIKFGSLEHVQRYVDGLMATDWFRETFPLAAKHPVTVQRRKTMENAHYSKNTINIFDHEYVYGDAGDNIAMRLNWGMREIVVLHELAHHCIHHHCYSVADHGPQFCGAFVFLVEQAMSPEAGMLLYAQMIEAGCAVIPWRVA